MPDVIAKRWSEFTTDEFYDIAKLRTDVFFIEQTITETELDGRDREAGTMHYWISDALGAAAYLRVLFDETPEHRDAHRVVGRVVVRADRRGEGLAQLLFERVFADFPGEPMLLHSQAYIAPLYAKVGFVEFGEPYDEAGIPHISMYRAGA
jgi:ElaA protein